MLKKVNICLCCDLNYLRYACVTIASVARCTKAETDFYILHREISLELQNMIKKWVKTHFSHCKLRFLDITQSLKKINVKQVRHFNALVFGRYFISELIPDIDKAIYLDSDTIVLSDISKLNNIDLNGRAVGGVYEYWQDNADWGDKIKNDLKYLELSETHQYFSSGVLVIDCHKWRKQKITKKLLDTYDEYREFTQYPDQDPLNKLFENNYQELEPIFNTTEQAILYYERNKTHNEVIDLKNNIVVRHFAGDNKPWNQVYLYSNVNGRDCSDNFNDWWFFASLTPFKEALENVFLEKQMLDFKQYEIPRVCAQFQSRSQSESVPNEKTYKQYKTLYKLFGFLPLISIKFNEKKQKKKYKLFNLLTLLSVRGENNNE